MKVKNSRVERIHHSIYRLEFSSTVRNSKNKQRDKEME